MVLWCLQDTARLTTCRSPVPTTSTLQNAFIGPLCRTCKVVVGELHIKVWNIHFKNCAMSLPKGERLGTRLSPQPEKRPIHQWEHLEIRGHSGLVSDLSSRNLKSETQWLVINKLTVNKGNAPLGMAWSSRMHLDEECMKFFPWTRRGPLKRRSQAGSVLYLAYVNPPGGERP